VKQIIHIFFLGISILFSFGFTSIQSACESKVERVEVKHSCCSATELSNDSLQEIESCCGTDLCEGICCIESGDYFQFNDFITETESIDLDQLELSLLPSIRHYLLSLKYSEVNLLQEELVVPPDLCLHKSVTKHIILTKQSWLI